MGCLQAPGGFDLRAVSGSPEQTASAFGVGTRKEMASTVAGENSARIAHRRPGYALTPGLKTDINNSRCAAALKLTGLPLGRSTFPNNVNGR